MKHFIPPVCDWWSQSEFGIKCAQERVTRARRASMPSVFDRWWSRDVEKLMEKVDVSDEQRTEAKKIAEEKGIPRGDVIHAILARDNNAILVSRDKHFQLLKDVCKVIKPEELI